MTNKEIWDEEDSFIPCQGCECVQENNIEDCSTRCPYKYDIRRWQNVSRVVYKLLLTVYEDWEKRERERDLKESRIKEEVFNEIIEDMLNLFKDEKVLYTFVCGIVSQIKEKMR